MASVDEAGDRDASTDRGPGLWSTDEAPREGSATSPMVPSRLDVRPGMVLFGRFRVVRKLGQGSMGEVWLVENDLLDRPSALKLIVGETPREVLDRFRTEARLMARLSHPNAVALHDADLGGRGGLAYIEMEYVPGRSLDRILRPGEPRPVAWVGAVVGALCDFLRAAHDSGIVHRDLKPSNLMIADDDGRLKVLDLGIAKNLRRDGRGETVVTEGFLGTCAYAAPEQSEGRAEPRSDLYAVGVIAFELLTGRRPFVGPMTKLLHDHAHVAPPSFAEVNPEAIVPAGVERVVRWCLAKDPEDRPESARVLAEAFRSAIDDGSPPVSRRRGRGPAIVGAATASAMILAAAVGLATRTPTAAPDLAIARPVPHPVVAIVASMPRPVESAPRPVETATVAVLATRSPTPAPARPILIPVPIPPTLEPPRELAPVVVKAAAPPLPARAAIPLRPRPTPVPAPTPSPTPRSPAVAVDRRVVRAVAPPAIKLNSVEMRLVRVAGPGPGTPRGLWIGAHEVTQAQYERVMGENHSLILGDDLPVTNVRWIDAVRFCNLLSRREGLAPAYRIEGDRASILGEGADGYRLPTDDEWSRGLLADASFGDSLPKSAWYEGNSRYQSEPVAGVDRGVHRVGLKAANPLGLHDVAGNAAEWTWPASTAGDLRPAFGGSYRTTPSEILQRKAHRLVRAETEADWIGFRVARPGPP